LRYIVGKTKGGKSFFGKSGESEIRVCQRGSQQQIKRKKKEKPRLGRSSQIPHPNEGFGEESDENGEETAEEGRTKGALLTIIKNNLIV